MKGSRIRLMAPLWIIGLLISCVTVNIYFPAREVEQRAEEIVGDIRKQEQTPPATPEKPQSRLPYLYAWFKNQGLAHAQKETEVSSPAIQALKNRMRERFPRLIPFFQKGALGEGNQGLLELRDSKGLSASEKVEVRQLAEAENRDRQTLYQEVARSLNITPDQINKIQRIFAEKWQQSSSSGWWIQKGDGQWVKK